jgi:hypothetical protein
MAESVKVIDPDMGSGYDYDSLYDWEAAQQADIDTSNTIAVAKCRCTGGTADTTAVTIGGWTTSATDYIKIWTDTSESYRHNGEYSTGNKYRIEITAGSPAIELSQSLNIRIIGIQIKAITAADWTTRYSIYFSYGDGSELEYFIEKCVFYGQTGSGGKHFAAIFAGTWGSLSGSHINISNCGFYANSNTDNVEGVVESNNSSGNLNIYNCTFKNFDTGIYQSSMTVRVKNCGFVGCTAATSGTITDATTNNTSPPTFESGKEFHLAPNDTTWKGQGTNLYNDATYPFQDDIDGQDRGGAAAAWDIGADEYVSAASIEQEGFRFRNDDGSESAATWKANQDTNITLAADTPFRLRKLLNATGDPASIGSQLEYRYKPSGGAFGSWGKVN